MVEIFVAIGIIILWTFWSGFTDASNSITTVVATRALIPLHAVGLAALGNLMGIFLGEAVAATIGKGIIDPTIVSGTLVIAAISGGMVYGVITYIRGLPISESQVLVGSLIGAGIAASGLSVVNYYSVIGRILVPMMLAPVIGFFITMLLAVSLIRSLWKWTKSRVNRYFGRFQIGSSLFFSITHGANDAQKSAGIIAALLVYYQIETGFTVPLWVKLVSFGALSLGTLLGGWRIVRTMGFRLVRLEPWQGFSAETGGALVVGGASQAGFPLSTTQTVSGSIMGVGYVRGRIRLKVARQVIIAWALTIPASAFFAFLIYKIILVLGL